MGTWETLTGEGGFGVCEELVDLGMLGAGERDRAVRRIVMRLLFVCGVRKWREGVS